MKWHIMQPLKIKMYKTQKESIYYKNEMRIDLNYLKHV